MSDLKTLVLNEKNSIEIFMRVEMILAHVGDINLLGIQKS